MCFRTWDADITRFGGSRGTEGSLVILEGARVSVIHTGARSHAWGRDRMERGLIVVIGGVDSVENSLDPAVRGLCGWGQARGHDVHEATGDVGGG